MRCLILLSLIAPGRVDEIELDYQNQRVEKRLPSGELIWATPLKGGLSQHREPHMLKDAARLYVSHGDGISALDRETGKVCWFAKGPNSRLYLSDAILLSVDCTS